MGFDPLSMMIEGAGALMGGLAPTAAMTLPGAAGEAAISAATSAATAQLVTGASALVGMGAAGMSAMAQNKAAKYNAAAIGREIQQTEESGQQQVQKEMMQTGQTIGAQRAAYGASGVDPNSGSAVQEEAQTAMFGKGNELDIEKNTANQVAALQSQRQATLAGQINPLLPMGASFLSSAATMSNSSATRAYYKSYALEGVGGTNNIWNQPLTYKASINPYSDQ